MQPIGEISNAFQEWVKLDLLYQSNYNVHKKHRFCGLIFSSLYTPVVKKMFVQ